MTKSSKNKLNTKSSTKAEVVGTSDYVPASVTDTNSTIMHMNVSAEKLMKRVVGREEKKEDPETLPSDEDWLDSMVRQTKPNFIYAGKD